MSDRTARAPLPLRPEQYAECVASIIARIYAAAPEAEMAPNSARHRCFLALRDFDEHLAKQGIVVIVGDEP